MTLPPDPNSTVRIDAPTGVGGQYSFMVRGDVPWHKACVCNSCGMYGLWMEFGDDETECNQCKANGRGTYTVRAV